MKTYWTYIMANSTNRVLYTGVTSNLLQRAWQHRNHEIKGFTNRYNVTKLVYYESTENVHSALAREKQIKAGSRQKKIDLITTMNPEFVDLYEDLIT